MSQFTFPRINDSITITANITIVAILIYFHIQKYNKYAHNKLNFQPSRWVVEYTDCISAEG